MVSIDAQTSFVLQGIGSGQGNNIRFGIIAGESGLYQFSLYDMNGMKLAVKQTQLSLGTQNLNMDNAAFKSGIYILTALHGTQQRVTKIAVQ